MAENFIDADDAPEWTDADFERAEIRAGGKVVRPMADEMKLAPGAVNFVPGLVDAEVFAGRLKAGETPVHLTGGVASGWKCRAVEGALGSFHVYERIEGNVRCVVDARLVQASVMAPDVYLEREWLLATGALSVEDQMLMKSTLNLAGALSQPGLFLSNLVEATIFEACAEAAYDAPHAQSDMELHHVVARDVIQAIIDRTLSPATVVELTRILREGGVDVPEATFD